MNRKLMVAGTTLAGLALMAGVAFADNDHESKLGERFKDAAESRHASALQIMGDGRVRSEGAKVTGISGNSISVSMTFGSTTLNGMVQTDANTKFVRKHDGKSSLSEIAIGDLLEVKGSLTGPGATVLAAWVKDDSIEKNAELNGTVKTANQASSSFVITGKRNAEFTVNVNGSTTVSGQATSSAGLWSKLAAGVRVSVRGMLNNASNVFTAASIRILK